MRVHVAGIATVVAITALVCVETRAQSLGALAKQEAERRKTVQEGKVFTNKDLPTVQPQLGPATPPTTTMPAAADSADATKDGSKPAEKDGKEPAKETAKDQPKDQKYWSGRQKALQEKLRQDESYAEAMQTRVNALTTDFTNRDDPAQRAVVANDRQKALDELERLKKAIVDDKKALSDFEEEARRAAVPPGWLR